MATLSSDEKARKQPQGEVPVGPKNKVPPAPGEAHGVSSPDPGASVPSVSSGLSPSGGGAPHSGTAGSSASALAAVGAISINGEGADLPSTARVQARERADLQGGRSPHAELRCVVPGAGQGLQASHAGGVGAVVQAMRGVGQASGPPTLSTSLGKGRGRKQLGRKETAQAQKPPGRRCLFPGLLAPQCPVPSPPSSPGSQPSGRRRSRASPWGQAAQPGPALRTVNLSQALLAAVAAMHLSQALLAAAATAMHLNQALFVVAAAAAAAAAHPSQALISTAAAAAAALPLGAAPPRHALLSAGKPPGQALAIEASPLRQTLLSIAMRPGRARPSVALRAGRARLFTAMPLHKALLAAAVVAAVPPHQVLLFRAPQLGLARPSAAPQPCQVWLSAVLHPTRLLFAATVHPVEALFSTTELPGQALPSKSTPPLRALLSAAASQPVQALFSGATPPHWGLSSGAMLPSKDQQFAASLLRLG
ncbi:EZH inhibitory protein-like [Lutra lutra]|uniref:EZH inhibitory protein-like n=1 Tax=Lutra lutra TaxID=9657 RepID=UPI001FD0A66A|nr:EZH inhibitory protein-like [Lutra lutra]XP_047571076.1 EZH inhibitory protein-like [Lutra lutra]